MINKKKLFAMIRHVKYLFSVFLFLSAAYFLISFSKSISLK